MTHRPRSSGRYSSSSGDQARQFRAAVRDAAANVGFGRKRTGRHLLSLVVDLLGPEESLGRIHGLIDERPVNHQPRPVLGNGHRTARLSAKKSKRHADIPTPKLKFRGVIGTLKRLTWNAGIRGKWTAQPNRVWRFRLRNGAAMSWSSTRGTIWFDGPPEAHRELYEWIENALRAWVYPAQAAQSAERPFVHPDSPQLRRRKRRSVK